MSHSPICIYPILDGKTLGRLGIPFDAAARGLLAAGPPWIQVREKDLPDDEVLSRLILVRELARPTRTKVMANDRPDLAALAQVDGVHLGQGDLPPEECRRLYPGLKIGVSTHTEAEFRAAQAGPADYVALGPIFPTQTKQNPEPCVGLEMLSKMAQLKGRKPLVAIGGIGYGEISQVAPLVDCVCLISSLFSEVVAAPLQAQGDDELVARIRSRVLALDAKAAEARLGTPR